MKESEGDFEVAMEILRKKGLSTAAKKSSRDTHEGIIGHYVHAGSKVASLVELNCETDFVARTEQYQQLAKDLAMHIVASKPEYIAREDVPESVIASEKEIYREQMVDSGKPEHVIRQNCRRQARQMVQRSLLARTAVYQGSGHNHSELTGG